MRASDSDAAVMVNSALTSLILWTFVDAYIQRSQKEPELALAYLVIPMAMSAQTAISLERTIATTGFLPWITSHPEVAVGLAEDVKGSLEITAQSLRFALAYRVLEITASGTLRPLKLAKRPSFPRSDSRARMFKVAKNLGLWMSQVPLATIFMSLGIEP